MKYLKNFFQSFPLVIILLFCGCPYIMPMEPAAPANVNATDGVYEDSVVITWDESTSQVDFYNVWRTDNEEDANRGRFTEISGDLENTSFTDETVIPGHIYYYRVKACSTWTHISESGLFIKDEVCNMEIDIEMIDDGYAGSL